MKLTTQQWLYLPVLILICYAVAYFGSLFSPGEWYENLNRAPWSPPNIAFPIVWSILYFFIAVAGWLIFNHGDSRLISLWVIQLTLNAAWSWIFFGQHWLTIGLIDLLLLIAVVTILIIKCWSQQLKLATILLIPYFLWLCIATSLNSYILIAN